MTPRGVTTPRQKEVRSFVLAFITVHGRSPTVRDIAGGLGMRHPHQASEIVRKLEARKELARADLIDHL
jgi:LexA DNA binding domain.